jgi:hypothetical protein
MTKDDFVLAVLAAADGANHTPVQVQKLFFLLDKKIPYHIGGTHFNFHPDDYGPFDSGVYRALEALSARGLVEVNKVADLRRKTYRTTSDGQRRGEAVLSGLSTGVADYIRQLSAWVRNLSFAELVSAIYAEFPDMKVNSVFNR